MKIIIYLIALMVTCGGMVSCQDNYVSIPRETSANGRLHSSGYLFKCDTIDLNLLRSFGEKVLDFSDNNGLGLPFDSVCHKYYIQAQMMDLDDLLNAMYNPTSIMRDSFIHIFDSYMTRLHPTGSYKNTPMTDKAARYISIHNKKMWEEYMMKNGLHEDTDYPLVSVYWIRNYSMDYMIMLMTYHYEGCERIIYGHKVTSSVYTDEEIFRSAQRPRSRTPIYGDSIIWYEDMIERNISLDSALKILSMPDYCSKSVLYHPNRDGNSTFIGCSDIDYFKHLNPELWKKYFEMDDNANIYNLPLVWIYGWYYNNDFQLWLVSYNIDGIEKIIYGMYIPEDYYIIM